MYACLSDFSRHAEWSRTLERMELVRPGRPVAERITSEVIEPGLREEDGFEELNVLLDMETGEGLVITLWSTAEAEQASHERIGQRFAALGQILTAPPQPSKVYEVV